MYRIVDIVSTIVHRILMLHPILGDTVRKGIIELITFDPFYRIGDPRRRGVIHRPNETIYSE
jgi:hypothetical protein